MPCSTSLWQYLHACCILSMNKYCHSDLSHQETVCFHPVCRPCLQALYLHFIYTWVTVWRSRFYLAHIFGTRTVNVKCMLQFLIISYDKMMFQSHGLTYLWDGQRQVFSHLPGVHQSVKLILQLLELLFPLAHLLSLQLVPLSSLWCRHRNRVQYRPLLRLTAAVWLVLLVRPELRTDTAGGPVRSGCAVCSVGGGSGGVVAFARTGQTGGGVGGCTAGGAAVL